MNTDVDNLKKFGAEFQTKCVASIVSDRAFLERIIDILEIDYFELDANKWIVETIKQYFLEYKDLPTMAVFKVKTDDIDNDVLKKAVIDQLKNVFLRINDTDNSFIKETFLEFCKNQKLKSAIYKSADFLVTGDYDSIKHIIDEAMKAGAERNLGHDYIEEVDLRLSEIARSCIHTEWDLLDVLLDGGLASGELGVVISSAGGGKSWVLAKLGAEAMKQGKNVLHYTLELNQNYVGRRYDSIFTGIDFQSITKHTDIVKQKLDELKSRQEFGKLKVKYFPIKTVSASSLKIHLDRCQMIDGIKYDMMIVDYADLLKPLVSDRNSNSYSEAGSIYEELRTVAGELQIPIWTASQGNRASADEEIITAGHVADSFRKIMTADFVMSLSRMMEDKVKNTARFHIIKNRFGPDGITLPSVFNASNGSITMYESTSPEGQEIMEREPEDGENAVRGALRKKWDEHKNED